MFLSRITIATKLPLTIYGLIGLFVFADEALAARPVLVAGTVIMSDGARPEGIVEIDVVCGDTVLPQGYADAEGKFTFQLDLNRQPTGYDASQSSPYLNQGSGSGWTSGNGATGDPLAECALRAELIGYRSSMIDLAMFATSSSPDLGSIVLTKVGPAVPPTVSVTASEAPKGARKAYNRGLKRLQADDFSGAGRQFTRAVKIDPDFADAWQELGIAQLRGGDTESARQSFEESIEADNKMSPSYLLLSMLAAAEKNWKNCVEYSERLAALEPQNIKGLYLNAIAHFKLRNFDQARSSAERVVALDTNHQFPLAGAILAKIP